MTGITTKFFVTFSAGEAFEPLFAARYRTMVEPASGALVTVIEPVNEPAESPLQWISAVPIVALLAAAARLPPTVAEDLGPPSGQPFPLSPGPAARAGEDPGTNRAVIVSDSTTSHESRRARRERAGVRE